MKAAFLLDVFAGYEVMRLAAQNNWRLIRVQTSTKGTRVLYLAD